MVIIISKFNNKKIFFSIIAIAIIIFILVIIIYVKQDFSRSSNQREAITKTTIKAENGTNATNCVLPNTATGCSENKSIKNYNSPPDSSNSKTMQNNSTASTNNTKSDPSVSVSTKEKNNTKPNISEKIFKKLILSGDTSIKKISTFLSKNNAQLIYSNQYYKKLPENIVSYDDLKNYLDTNLNLSAYYTDNFINKFINKIFKKINGQYYIVEGNFGLGIDLSTAKIISQTYTDNRLNITFSTKSQYDSSPTTLTAILISKNGQWFIDQFDPWGMF